MGRKRNPYIQLFTRDILSSPRCRALSESAAGVYLFLLCRLNEPPTPGAYRISDWELHPTWKRSKTQQCLATADKYERLQYFAAMLSKNDLPWKQAAILAGLQELYKYGIVTVEGDMLVQPRMFKDNGFELPDLDNDGDPIGTILDDPTSGSMALRGDDDFIQNNGANNGAEKRTDLGTKKVQKKVRVSHAGATRALSVENMSNNSNSIGNKGVQGGVTPVKSKTQEKSPNDENGASEREKKSGTGNLSSDAQKRADSPKNGSDGQKIPVADQPPTLREIQDYMQQRGEGGDPFRHITAEQFYDEGCMSGWTIRGGQPLYDWRARLRSLEGYRRKNGEPTVTQEGYVAYRDGKLIGTLAVRTNNNNKGYEGSRNNQRGAARSQGGHTEGDDGMLQQSVRIISRLRASREAEGSDGTDSDGDPF